MHREGTSWQRGRILWSVSKADSLKGRFASTVCRRPERRLAVLDPEYDLIVGVRTQKRSLFKKALSEVHVVKKNHVA